MDRLTPGKRRCLRMGYSPCGQKRRNRSSDVSSRILPETGPDLGSLYIPRPHDRCMVLLNSAPFRADTYDPTIGAPADAHDEFAIILPVPAGILRFDTDVLDWPKAYGKGYQTRINRILRALTDSQPPRSKTPKKNTRSRAGFKPA